ncbi:MAG: hypothetical protein OXS32_08320 [Verrucomicrobiales bacterium]|nr:hypothetical protein [Verrucomicrobiales bacterium]
MINSRKNENHIQPRPFFWGVGCWGRTGWVVITGGAFSLITGAKLAFPAKRGKWLFALGQALG